MRAGALGLSTKELTESTLPDFEKLFEKHPAPGAYLCWCTYHLRSPQDLARERTRSRAEIAARNRRLKRELVGKGSCHGILVYSQGEPVGWCQYGLREELPRIDGDRGYRRLVKDDPARRVWRVTCFTVAKEFRRRGVAGVALKAALGAIRKSGGGLVEGYPITSWGAYREYLGSLSMFQREGFRVVGAYGKNNVVVRRRV
jgi:GNAT superfamily N-acetyltransferase